jgi:hypothetical protein
MILITGGPKDGTTLGSYALQIRWDASGNLSFAPFSGRQCPESYRIGFKTQARRPALHAGGAAEVQLTLWVGIVALRQSPGVW